MNDGRMNVKDKITRKGAWRGAMKKLLFGLTVFMLVLVLCPTSLVRAQAQTIEVGIPVEERPELFLTRSMPTRGEGKIAVFLIEFPDYKNENPVATREYYDGLYFSGGVKTWWENDDTVSEFFYKQSYGKLNISGQVFDWYTAKHERSYYDEKKEELIIEAAEYYQAQGVDFSDFDGNLDDVIDAIVFHFAGDYSTDRYEPWYNGVTYFSGSGGFDNIGDKAFTTMVQIHDDAETYSGHMAVTICHELMHTLGMPDLYSEVSLAHPTNDLMASMNIPFINPYLKLLLGWIETAQVVTEDTDNIRLDAYGGEKLGDFVIVTDEFNGLYDEFYIVAYRKYAHLTTAVVWHIDARLNENGTAFRYNNLRYDHSPDTDNGHEEGYTSPYLFIEELSSDPTLNFVLSPPVSDELTAFGEGSVLGPDSFPSSDTHDGEYTGIRMDNFVEHDKEYLTFDVSFVEDTAPPVITTSEDELEFKEKVMLYFNEYIYKGEGFDGIAVTDLDGTPLNATVKLSHYPRHEMEILFADDTYKKGYKIVFPEGSVCDSSGNGIEAVSITAPIEKYLFPTSEKQLPSVAEGLLRSNGSAHFFDYDDSLLVITGLWENYVSDARFELMRLDRDGNVLSQVIIDNPFDNSRMIDIFETGDGHYIFMCKYDEAFYTNMLFCIDANGDLKWTSDLESDNPYANYQGFRELSFKTENGIVCLFTTQHPEQSYEWRHIDSDSGKIQSLGVDLDAYKSGNFSYGIFNLPNGRLLQQGHRAYINGKFLTPIRILDADTYEVVVEGYLDGEIDGMIYVINNVQANDDGTILIHFSAVGDTRKWIQLLDARLRPIRTISWDKNTVYGDTISWFDNDGFCHMSITEADSHSNYHYHVRRYDRHLNLIWESDVVANFIHYFKSSSGDIMGYKSMWAPERECYIEYYGSEASRRVEHEHTLTYVDESAPNCIMPTFGEYWYCADCGCMYSDEGETLIADTISLVTPATGHTMVFVPGIEPTCTSSGTSGEVICGACEEILQASAYLPPNENNHSFGVWTVTQEATCKDEGIKEQACSECDRKNTRVIPVNEKYHDYGEWSVTVEPTCVTEGIREQTCSVCGDTQTDSVYVDLYQHESLGEWTVTKEATCSTKGKKMRVCTSCGAEETRTLSFDESNHTYGNWRVAQEATCKAEGEELRSCSCGNEETRPIPIDEGNHSYSEWVTVTEATCTTEGERIRRCACGNEETDPIPIDEENHTDGEWEIIEEATCGRKGEALLECAACGTVTRRTLPVDRNHTLGEWTVTEAATCGRAGEEMRQCSCGKARETRAIPAADEHSFGEWVVTREATAEAEGEVTATCQHCGETISRPLTYSSDGSEPWWAPLAGLGVIGVIGIAAIGILVGGGVLTAVAAVGGVGIAVFFILKKKFF